MIEVTRDESVWTVSLNRPDKANALTAEMLGAIERVASEAERAEVAAFVLTGRGKVFSAGADLDEARAGLATDGVWERVSGRIAGLPCLTVAALNGTLAGGAFGMALACDIRIAVAGAAFFYPVLKHGFLPQPSDPGRLVALIGPARAKCILMAAERIDAATAYDWGLVDRVVAPDALAETVAAMTAAARGADPETRKAIKRLIDPPA